ncbi:Wzz/FepE/Etk N-terminal domain-containing protein [Gammaproteobacteria bacterium]|nr:Wzz/FepE/Etk N-terminal domain-containing protein [Gammaproteobacteria bacterium]
MNNENHQNDEVNLVEVISVLWGKKLYIILISTLAVILAVFYSLSLPNIYKSDAVLASASSSGSNLSGIASQYSGVAGLAGISLPSGTGSNKVSMGIEVVKSLDFFERFVKKHDIFFILEAPYDWDRATDTLIINPKIYDTTLNKWVSEDPYALNGKPSLQSAHRNFHQNFSINLDTKTSFIYVSMMHYSPYVAKDLLDLIILEINQMTQNEDITTAKNSIKFLEDEYQKINVSDVRSGINNLIEKQLETIAVANSSPEYLFKILSPPKAPEIKSLPDRKIIVIVTFLASLILSSAFFLTRFYFQSFISKN